MDFGQIAFLAAMAVVVVVLFIKRKAAKTIIDERGSPQMRVDAAKEAQRVLREEKERGGS